jgi:hypothetical protein
VSVLTLFGYGNFAQQVNKVKRKLHGDELARYAWELVERYVGMGLDRKVLEDIRFNVFTIGPPFGETQNSKL